MDVLSPAPVLPSGPYLGHFPDEASLPANPVAMEWVLVGPGNEIFIANWHGAFVSTTQNFGGSFLLYLSPAVEQDQFFNASANTLDPLLADVRSLIPVNQVIGNLPNIANFLSEQQAEVTLDFLAVYHFDLDTYYIYNPADSTAQRIARKLQFVLAAITSKIRKGTPSMVKAAMNNAFSYAELIEWFTDLPPISPWQNQPTATPTSRGAPSTFRIQIADPLTDPNKVSQMVSTILKVKNARSYFSGISSFETCTGAEYIGLAIACYDYLIVRLPVTT
jgi:P2-related tail formation protein